MPEQDENKSKYNPETVDDAKKIIDALEKRLAEREADNQRLKGEIGDYGKRLAAIEEGQKKKLEEDGNWKDLAAKRLAENETLRLTAERATALEAVIRQSNEAAIARIPEARRGLIPLEYAPEKLQSWLASNTALLTREPAPDFNAGEGAGDSNPKKKIQLSDVERAAAAGAGLSEEEYAFYKAQRGEAVDIKPPADK
jgi:hypothetical protein